MPPLTPALLDALADCLQSGDALPDALAKVATAGGAAAAWAERVRRSARHDVSLAGVLHASGVIDDSERALLSTDGADTVAPALLHAVALRRRRRAERRHAVLRGLVGPFAVAAVTVILDPLSSLVSGESFVWPVVRGLLLLAVLALAIAVGIPVLLRDPRRRSTLLRLASAIPGAHAFAALHAEEELATVLVPFAEGGEVAGAGLTAAAALLDGSPLGEAARLAGRATRPGDAVALAGLGPLTRHLSLATNLALVGGGASLRLAERLHQRAEAISALLTSRLRLVARVAAYAAIVVFSLVSLAAMVARGIPGMPSIPGGAPGGSGAGADQKEIEELMKQLQ
jgi:hypothetical protein